jgi:hypothetical protein
VMDYTGPFTRVRSSSSSPAANSAAFRMLDTLHFRSLNADGRIINSSANINGIADPHGTRCALDAHIRALEPRTRFLQYNKDILALVQRPMARAASVRPPKPSESEGRFRRRTSDLRPSDGPTSDSDGLRPRRQCSMGRPGQEAEGVRDSGLGAHSPKTQGIPYAQLYLNNFKKLLAYPPFHRSRLSL